MSQSLGSLFVELKANTAAFVDGMSKASYQSKQLGRDIESSFSRLGGVLETALAPMGEIGQVLGGALNTVATTAGGAARELGNLGALSTDVFLGGIGTASVAAAAALATLAIKGSDVVENFALVSEKTGIGISQLQTWQAAGETVGVSLEDMVGGMRKFDEALSGTMPGATAVRAEMQKLGITSHDNNEALLQLADAFRQMPDGAEKSALAVELLGRSGLNLIPILDKGRAGIEEFQGIVDEFGPTISDGAISATDDWKKSTLEMNEAWQRFEVNITTNVLPTVAWLTEKLAVALKTWGDFATKTAPRLEIDVSTLGVAPAAGAVNNWLNPSLPEQGHSNQAAQAAADAHGALQKEITDFSVLQTSYSKLYETLKAGGADQLRLSELRAGALKAASLGDFSLAAQYEQQVQSLEAILKQEQDRERLNAKLADEIARQNIETGRIKSPKHQYETVQAPDLASIPASQVDAARQASDASNATIANLKEGSATLSDFYREWDGDAKQTAASVNESYSAQFDQLNDLVAAGKISLAQYSDAINKMGEAWNETLKQVRVSTGTETIKDAAGDLFDSIQQKGADVVGSFFHDMGNALEQVNDQIAKVAVTGKANFRQVATGLGESALRTGLSKAESLGAGKLESLFGIKSGKKPTGAAGDPLHVVMDAGGAAGSAAAAGSILGSIGKIGGSFGGIGGLLSKFGGIFGGFLAGGGDVTPGKAYVVGEKHPEFFVPKQAGQVAPTMKIGSGGGVTNVAFHVHGVADADSFKKSQSQIGAMLVNQLAIARSRSY